MAPKPLPEQSVLLQLLRYEPETGKLYWRERPASFFPSGTQQAKAICVGWNKRYAGEEALANISTFGYLQGRFLGEMYKASRIIWKMIYGTDPGPEVDHEDGNRANNKLNNLTSSNKLLNQKNCFRRSDNTSGRTGVYRHKGGWCAIITANKKSVFLGAFASFDDAVEARSSEEKRLGFTKRHGTLKEKSIASL